VKAIQVNIASREFPDNRKSTGKFFNFGAPSGLAHVLPY
jgi:hypothetical protein